VYIWKLFQYYPNFGSCRTLRYKCLTPGSMFIIQCAESDFITSFLNCFVLFFQIVEPFTAHYVFALGVARFLSCAHWVLQVCSWNFVFSLVSSLIHLQVYNYTFFWIDFPVDQGVKYEHYLINFSFSFFMVQVWQNQILCCKDPAILRGTNPLYVCCMLQ
jgi:hypothetical protein